MKFSLPWDPEVESPATIAILGGGPIGIEAAIYARFLGYFVTILEARRVAHRMLDWHDRPLALPAGAITTSLGHAAIGAQNPEYRRIDPDRVLTGKQYAEEYLLPLAKTDLLFDDIHFLSPVIDIARLRTTRDENCGWQERCNDEFRILVQGRHRGPWIARADCILDCRGDAIVANGMGPGGGKAIGESDCEADFYAHAPDDRKFERKKLQGARLALVGQSTEACHAAEAWLRHFPTSSDGSLVWIVRPRGDHESETFRNTLAAIERSAPDHVVVLQALGVDAIQRTDAGGFRLRLLKDDDSTVDLDADLVMRRTGHHWQSIAQQLHVHAPSAMRAVGLQSEAFPEGAQPGSSAEADDEARTELALPDDADPSYVTAEPGYYVLSAGSLESGAGAGIPAALKSIREVFAMLGGRADLDLYAILEKQLANQ